MEEEGWSEAKKVAPKLGPRVFWRRRGANKGKKITLGQLRNQTPMVRRRDSSGPKRYPRKRGPMVFWRRSAFEAFLVFLCFSFAFPSKVLVFQRSVRYAPPDIFFRGGVCPPLCKKQGKAKKSNVGLRVFWRRR